MQILGLDLKFTDLERPWAGWKHPDTARPLFVVGKPFNGESATLGNGQMIALLAPNRQIVHNAHALALVLDGNAKALRACDPSTTRIFMGRTFETLKETNFASVVTIRNSSSVGSIFG